MMRHTRRNRFARYLLPLLALLATPLAAAEPRLYDVEVIIFTQNGSGGDSEVAAATGAPAQPRGTFPPGEFTELSSGSYRLNNVRGGLSAARGYHVLFHRAWRQPGFDGANAVDYPVHTQAGNGRDSVDGTITLSRERFLHLDVDLRMATGGDASASYPDGTGSRPAYRMVEKRRIRSSETHYFDHPRFGVIARVTPFDAVDEPAAPVDEPVPDDAAAGAQEEEPVPAEDQLTR